MTATETGHRLYELSPIGLDCTCGNHYGTRRDFDAHLRVAKFWPATERGAS